MLGVLGVVLLGSWAWLLTQQDAANPYRLLRLYRWLSLAWIVGLLLVGWDAVSRYRDLRLLVLSVCS